jgi:hypothetical protein
MDYVSDEDKLLSIKSLQSSIRKSEKASAQMTEKGANTTLLSKRLKALQIGLAALEKVWSLRSHEYTKEDLAEARDTLMDLLPSIEKIYAKSKVGSPQKTLLERRIMSLKLSVQAIEDVTCEELK